MKLSQNIPEDIVLLLKLALLAFSPLGIIVVWFALLYSGICDISPLHIGGNISCSISILELYPGVIANWFEISCYFFICIPWFIFALYIWFKLLFHLVKLMKQKLF